MISRRFLFAMASDVSAFFEKVNSDPALKAKAKAIGTSDWSKITAFAKELGFSFTPKDVNEHLGKQLGESNDLNDDDLSSVAGGTVSATALTAVVGTTGVAAQASHTAGSGW